MNRYIAVTIHASQSALVHLKRLAVMAESSSNQLLQILDVFEQLKLTSQQIKYIVLLLGVPLNKLDDIDGSRKDEKYAKALLDVEDPPNWGKMVAALRILGLNTMADCLKQGAGITIAENPPMSPLTHTFFLLTELTQAETRSLFLQLGVPIHCLDDIDDEYRGNNRNIHYIQAWLDKETQPSLPHIIVGLQKIGKVALADKISKFVAN